MSNNFQQDRKKHQWFSKIRFKKTHTRLENVYFGYFRPLETSVVKNLGVPRLLESNFCDDTR